MLRVLQFPMRGCYGTRIATQIMRLEISSQMGIGNETFTPEIGRRNDTEFSGN